jgi:hypothetical protein
MVDVQVTRDSCKGCGTGLRNSANSLDGLCEQTSYPTNRKELALMRVNCSTLFAMWLLRQGDLAPKILACTLTSTERSIAIDEWLMSK